MIRSRTTDGFGHSKPDRRLPSAAARGPRGQIMVIITLVIVTLIGAVALCTDVAILYLNWAQLQKSADAAALAGANYLPANQTTARRAATSYLTTVATNGKPSDTVTITFPKSTEVQVHAMRTVPYFFGRVLGLTSAPVSVTSIAGVVNVNGGSGFLPIGLQCSGTFGGPGCNYPVCTYPNACAQLQLINVGPSGGAIVPGNWGKLRPAGGNGTKGWDNVVQNGYQGPPLIAGVDSIPTDTGVFNNPNAKAVNARLSTSACAGSCNVVWADVPQDPRVVLIPLVDFTGTNGTKPVPIIAFMTAWIVGIDAKTGTLTVNLIQSVSGSGTGTARGPATGALAVTLLGSP